MDEVARLARALVADDEVERLRGMAGLARYPAHPLAVAELMESVKHDLLGELSIVAAIALADMHRTHPTVASTVAGRYRETVGSVALWGGPDPTLRLSYFFAVANCRDWFAEMLPADVPALSADVHLTRYLAAGRDGDVRSLVREVAWFENLHRPAVLRSARRLLPGWNHWFRPLIRAAR